jgi:putative membrane protein
MTLADLPVVNAGLNALSAIFLGLGYYQIRVRKNQLTHRNCMIAAFITSVLFLICYITYHAYVAYYLHRGPTVFRNPPWFRPIYLALLGTHTLLAIVIVPLAIASLWLGLKLRLETHKKLSRWTWPIWMYVSVTGVLIYFLLYRIFPQTA